MTRSTLVTGGIGASSSSARNSNSPVKTGASGHNNSGTKQRDHSVSVLHHSYKPLDISTKVPRLNVGTNHNDSEEEVGSSLLRLKKNTSDPSPSQPRGGGSSGG